ncbi:MAG: hypothetical protein H0X30_39145 [Anaerolineae bacterium]|nr:hypothetical protein [Anaerolineae bacterium]
MSTNPNPDLMRIFDFTAADLEANRAGRMSEREMQRLQNISAKQRSIELLAAVSLPVGMCVFLLFVHPSYGICLFLLFPLPIALAMLFLIFIKHKKLMSDIATQKVEYLEGEVKYWSGRAFYGYMKINGREFEIDPATNLELSDFMEHQAKQLSLRLYFSPTSKKVVSAEILR